MGMNAISHLDYGIKIEGSYSDPCEVFDDLEEKAGQELFYSTGGRYEDWHIIIHLREGSAGGGDWDEPSLLSIDKITEAMATHDRLVELAKKLELPESSIGLWLVTEFG